MGYLIIGGLVALILIIAVSIAFYIISSPKQQKDDTSNSICIIGHPDSGKTKLFYHLIFKKNFDTVTSQVMNSYFFDIDGKKVNIIDLPGHPRMKAKVLNTIRSAKGIIFAIDSETIVNNISNISGLLYDVLSTPEVLTNKTPILIVGTKSDLPKSKDSDFIKNILEEEINYSRKNRTRSDYVDQTFSQSIYIGDEDQEQFHFDQLNNKITFASISVFNSDIESVMNFIRLLA